MTSLLHTVGIWRTGAFKECRLHLFPLSWLQQPQKTTLLSSPGLQYGTVPSVLRGSSYVIHFSTQWQNHIVTDGISTDTDKKLGTKSPQNSVGLLTTKMHSVPSDIP